jgi:predicted nucleotidyltransferase
MSMLPQADRETRRALAALQSEAETDRDVIALLAFGSAARGERARDVDVAVVLRPQSAALGPDKTLQYAAHSSGTKGVGLDVCVFQDVPLYLRHRILRDAHILWTRDEPTLYDVALATVREWEDFRPHYEMYLQEVARG